MIPLTPKMKLTPFHQKESDLKKMKGLRINE